MHPLDSRKLGTRQCVSVGKAVIDAVTQLVDLMHRLRFTHFAAFRVDRDHHSIHRQNHGSMEPGARRGVQYL